MRWEDILSPAKAPSSKGNLLQPPCPDRRVDQISAELGPIPLFLQEMLHIANGAELFSDAIAFVTVFGLTIPGANDAMPELWHIDRFTQSWRGSGPGRATDWAFAMSCYGGLFLLRGDNLIYEWDTGESRWLQMAVEPEDWFRWLLQEGAEE